MEISYDSIIWSLRFAIGFQLILFGILSLFKNEHGGFYLAILCLIFSEFLLIKAFWDYFSAHPFLLLFFGGGKNIFIGPVLYLYLKRKLDQKEMHILKHLAFPAIFYLLYLSLRYLFPDFYQSYRFPQLALFNNLSNLGLGIIYSFLIARLYQQKLRKLIIPKARKNYLLLICLLMGFVLLAEVMTLTSFLTSDAQSGLLYILNEYYIQAFYLYVMVPAKLLIGLFLGLFCLGESNFFRKYLQQTKAVKGNQYMLGHLEEIEVALQQNLIQPKLYLNADLNLKQLAEITNFSSKQISDYLQWEKGLTFRAYLNSFRIAAFKELTALNQQQYFDIEGLALKSGFKSRSTFYRAFKEQEKMTPKKYLEQVELKEKNK